MKLSDAIAAGLPLAIDLGQGNDRIMALAWPAPGGLLFAGVYWLSDSNHPFHFVPGAIVGDGPWTVGDARIRQIEHGDPRAAEFNRWASFLAGPQASNYDPVAARDAAFEILEP